MAKRTLSHAIDDMLAVYKEVDQEQVAAVAAIGRSVQARLRTKGVDVPSAFIGYVMVAELVACLPHDVSLEERMYGVRQFGLALAKADAEGKLKDCKREGYKSSCDSDN